QAEDGIRDFHVTGVQTCALPISAQTLPLADGALDAVVCAQAFHWFAGREALDEFHRVLRPGGRLGLVWNVRDESVDWVAELTAIDRKSTRLNSSHVKISYAGFCL